MADREVSVMIERVRSLLRAHVASGDIVAREEVNAELDRLEHALAEDVGARTRVETIRDYARLTLELQDPSDPEELEDVDTGPAGEPAAFGRAIAELDALEREAGDPEG